ncbi:MAG: NHL repeat-containing protein [Armatimonadota bacterium]|nr:NHL repeat-containing protein [Armatimonadota bacterium]
MVEPQVYQLDTALSHPGVLGVDEYGRFYVLDSHRQSLMRFSMDGRLEKSWPEGFGDSCPWAGRDGMTVLPGERVFLAPAPLLENVREIGPGGLDRLLPFKARTRDGRNIVAFDDGSYYSGCCADDHGEVFGYSADGTQCAHWDTPFFGVMAPGPDQTIYVNAATSGKIQVYDRHGKLIREIKKRFSDHIEVDTNGDLYMLNPDAFCRFDGDGKLIAKFKAYVPPPKSPTEPRGGLALVRDVAVYNGVVYASFEKYPGGWEIQQFTPDGQCVARYIPPSKTLELPAAIAVQPDGTYRVEQHASQNCLIADPGKGFYVADDYKLTYVRLGSREEETIHRPTVREDRAVMDTPTALTRDPATGNLWALCISYPVWRILIFGPDHKEIERITIKTGLKGFLGGMALDPGKRLYIADSSAGCISQFDMDGSFIGAIGKEGDGIGELSHPVGIVRDNQGRLYVADTGNSRIQVFSPDGVSLGCWGHRGTGDGELDRPLGIALGPNDTLWITDTQNDRIVKIPLTKFWQQISLTPPPKRVAVVPKPQPAPAAGKVAVTGVVVSGTDDLEDFIYIENEDRTWGVKVTPPRNAVFARGSKIKAVGTLTVTKAGSRKMTADSAEAVSAQEVAIGPLGMANLHVGDGYRPDGHRAGPSNLNLLVRTWGRVTFIDKANNRFRINDGSHSDADDLLVIAEKLRSPITTWPKIGDYVGLTGISETLETDHGSPTPAIRVRSKDDVEILAAR